jgi:hypothetical protein
MKAKYTVLAFALTAGSAAMAQEVDDMYFNAKDRLAMSEKNQTAMASRYASYDQQAVKMNPVNPSDSYTGRGVNPEFSAQQKNGAEIIQENPDYFLSSYQPKNINSNLYSASSTTSGCGCYNPYSSMSYNGLGSYGMYSPYGAYSPYGLGGYGYGRYGSMITMSMGYGMSSMYGYPYGMSPYGYYPSYGYGYPSTGMGSPVDVRPRVTGPHPVRTGSSTVIASNAPSYVATNGRTRGTGSRTQSNYYDASWRSNPANYPTRSYATGGRAYNSSFGSTPGRSWSGDTGRTRSYDSYGSGTRSTSGGFSGGGSSSSGGGGGGGGHSRGRN